MTKKSKRKFRYRENAVVLHKVPVQEVGKELDRIALKFEGFQPQNIVDESKPEEAVLHRAFEWDNGVAGNNWRKHEARQIVKTVEVLDDVTNTPVPAYVNVRVVNVGQTYQTGPVVVIRNDMMASAYAELLGQLTGLMLSLEKLITLDSHGGYKQSSKELLTLIRNYKEDFNKIRLSEIERINKKDNK
ncbi:MAG: hypothetical protein GQ468_02790 [Candidatus Scalindua sp.]|nr:hypothetical protein [Candidatus Scalindua sp.]